MRYLLLEFIYQFSSVDSSDPVQIKWFKADYAEIGRRLLDILIGTLSLAFLMLTIVTVLSLISYLVFLTLLFRGNCRSVDVHLGLDQSLRN